jgi:hypothetical protein
MAWAEHIARMVEVTTTHAVFVRKPEGKTPLGTPRLREE